MRKLLVLLALSLPVMVVSAAGAQDTAELTGDHNVVTAYATPHTDWLTPSSQGKARVLFFVRGHGTEPREAIELGQRFDLDFQMVFWARIVDSPKEGWHGGENGVRRMDRLLAEKWDAFVFLGIPLSSVPTEQQYKLLKQVIDGAGLVLRGQDDNRVLKPKNQLPDLPAFLNDVPGAAAFSVQKGRGLRVATQPALEYAPGWEMRYDQWAMRLGKAVLWAAGKAPQAALSVSPLAPEIARASLPGPAAALKWSQMPSGAKVDLALRRDDGVVMMKAQQALAGATGEVSLNLPLVRAGEYYLDAICRDGKTAVTCASTPLLVTSPRAITGITFEQNWGEVGEKLVGKATCTGARPGAGERLLVSLLDRRGRELVRQDTGPGGAESAFAFTLADWFPMLLTVRATLVSGQDELASAWQFAHVVKRNRGQFNFLIWDLPGGTLAPYAEESLARNAMTLQLSGNPTPPNYVGAYDIAWVPYTTHIGGQKDANGVMKPACYNDEEGIQKYVDDTVKKYEPSRQHGAFVYSLGDEISVRASCKSPHCLAAYQKYLQEQYGDIAALNTSWGTTFGGFEEITLSQPDDDNEMEAFRAGNFPRWFDRQAYQSYNFCKLCERFGRGFRTLDPDSRCGFEGAGTFGAADDLDGFVRSNTFWSPYPGTADEVVRSIAPRDFPRSNWMGYTKDPDSLLEKYWRMVTRGTDAVWWWRWDCIGAFHGWLSPTLDPYPTVKEILRDTQVVRDGLGDLLLHSQLQDDGIGILFSHVSAYASRAQAGPSFGAYEGCHTAWHTALRDLGYNFRYITDRQLRLGEQKPGQFKVFLLPFTQALGPVEAQALREYVQNGGVLIADARPGIYDGHCKPFAAGALDDVFGVKRTGFPQAEVRDGEVKVTMNRGGKPVTESLALSRIRVDGGIEAAGATALGAAGNTPLFLVNNFGKGKAILLNAPLSSFPSLAADTTPELVAQAVQMLLNEAQMAPAFGAVGAQGHRLRNAEVTRWTNGAVQVASFFRHAGLPEAAKIALPRELYVYDLKARRDLGKLKSLDLKLTPCRAQMFAFSPTPLPAVMATVAPQARRGTVPRLMLRSALPAGQQAVKVQVKGPDGQVADWLTKVVVVDRRGTELKLPLALNDPVGTWQVMVTELCTNKTGVSRFTVR